jgi:hypothetical protein
MALLALKLHRPLPSSMTLLEEMHGLNRAGMDLCEVA